MRYLIAALSLLLVGLTACHPRIPTEALQLSPESLALRQLQTRRYDTSDEKKLLQAGASLLQDMGFQIDESELKLGVLVGSKQADATDAGQIVGSILLAALTGHGVAVDKEQKVRVSLVTRPLNPSQMTFRATFQRIVWNTEGRIGRVESLEEPELYQDFFEKLSKSVFLEAHTI